jgi:DNA gyrase subunit B
MGENSEKSTIEDNSVKLEDENPLSEDYNANNIVVLEGLDGVRKRPAMYIGSTGKRGFHHLAFEILDNSIDEALAGHCSEINVILEKDNSLRINDNGRGIPTELHPIKKIPTLEVIFSSLHSGGKFDKKSYAVSGGLHGVGLAVVNACSEWAYVRVWREGKKFELKMGKGHILETTHEAPSEFPEEKTGTEIQFYPDKEIFTGMEEDQFFFDYEILTSRLRDLAFLNPIKITITDNREDEIKSELFEFEHGLSDFVRFLNQAKKSLHPDPINFHKEKEGVVVDLAIQYNESYIELIQCFVNNINTVEGGTHLTGYKTALTRVFNDYIKQHPRDFKGEQKTLKGSDVREGLVAVLAVRVPEPQFEGQTKTKLGNPEVKAIVSELVYEEISHFFDTNPTETKAIIRKGLMAQNARIASQKARELTRRKGVLDGLRLPGKLADCSSKNPEDCELFIVEGDSAGGSAKQGRDRATQAILPLRGKILNVEKSRLAKILASKEIGAMIKAIGVGICDNISDEDDDEENENGQADKNFDITKLRYNKIIIMCDADIDGHHIETLLLTFFFRYMKPLIENGHVFLAVPPIYKLSHSKKFIYLYDEKKLSSEMDRFQKTHKISDPSKIKVQRYKGLGEMNPEELWDTTMEPEGRRLHRVVFVDFAATSNIFSILMGDEVEPRRNYITEHYHEVVNLDI